MAEIKSTMDLVMERAARIGKASDEEMRRDKAAKKGVGLAVGFLDDTIADLAAEMRKLDRAEQMDVLKGVVETLLRNVYLPRDEVQQERAEKAVRGILSLEGGSGEIGAICRELTNIFSGYLQHRDQLRGQLEEQIKMQYEAMLAQQPELQSAGVKIDPTLQPKFQEEWRRVEGELSSQYGRALDQLKEEIGRRFGIQ
ncbi:MAG: hypothetical protein Kow0089_14540 [Desulfobulbaceae bacterium]